MQKVQIVSYPEYYQQRVKAWLTKELTYVFCCPLLAHVITNQ